MICKTTSSRIWCVKNQNGGGIENKFIRDRKRIGTESDKRVEKNIQSAETLCIRYLWSIEEDSERINKVEYFNLISQQYG